MRVEKKEPLSAMFEQFNGQRSEYLVHRYQVCNDCYEWKNILHTTNNYGMIFHADHSENISGSPKYEPQSAYFSKEQYTLRCTVAHTLEDDELIFISCQMTESMIVILPVIIEELIQHTKSEGEQLEFIRIKSDNCSSQYKSKKIFAFYSQLALDHQKMVLIYYGVAGHGKGIVDAMSSFGVKEPLRKEKRCRYVTKLYQPCVMNCYIVKLSI